MISELPTLTLVAPITEAVVAQSAKISSHSQVEQKMDGFERKVVLTAGFILTPSDKHRQCVRKIADCLADAVGLNVDFSTLLA